MQSNSDRRFSDEATQSVKRHLHRCPGGTRNMQSEARGGCHVVPLDWQVLRHVTAARVGDGSEREEPLCIAGERASGSAAWRNLAIW